MTSRIARKISKSVLSRAQMDGDGARGILIKKTFYLLQQFTKHYFHI